jgi:enoyl-CoA hydratase
VSGKYTNFEHRDGIAWVQFNRPEKLNALNPDVLKDLERAITHCEEDDTIRVVVLMGNERAFAAGADIDHMAEADVKSAYQLTDRTIRVQERLADLPKPTIAAIAEITLGVVPGGGGTQRLPRLVGLGPATELIFLGEMIDAAKAERIGLANKVVPLDQLKAEVEELAHKLMKRPSLALRAAKTAMRKGLNISLKEGLQLEQDLFCMLFGTEDQKEGMAAFLEKRKPGFKGR